MQCPLAATADAPLSNSQFPPSPTQTPRAARLDGLLSPRRDPCARRERVLHGKQNDHRRFAPGRNPGGGAARQSGRRIRLRVRQARGRCAAISISPKSPASSLRFRPLSSTMAAIGTAFWLSPKFIRTIIKFRSPIGRRFSRRKRFLSGRRTKNRTANGAAADIVARASPRSKPGQATARQFPSPAPAEDRCSRRNGLSLGSERNRILRQRSCAG